MQTPGFGASGIWSKDRTKAEWDQDGKVEEVVKKGAPLIFPFSNGQEAGHQLIMRREKRPLEL